ncbi:MAG: UDP-forming cellulose synthase catalytic subunit [Methylomonas sp.]|nr:UDP-forming cellulose synthase catalytic subunit [Methylomonas sp.]PPD22418.1 MAG: cellulose synthase catalytic subunit (UDP-forming) [Methylomonas sp.]PPD26189.1 MAG: cellulose synthase catalytic subunit (UDP-forming) [Methylomonas sp.]PPD37906.1 MAG: cellulose synthase catalytic subunit (UDP-forming) [Methylomonas sp.]PPD42090.1 MAG: cellulose synthase catalytic subunit (UDP-forming) [Methylomonas sp.]
MSAIDFSKRRFAAIDLFPVAGALLTSLMIAALGLASLRVDSALQASTSALLVAVLFLMRQASGRDFVRVVFLLVSFFIAVRYFSWRVQFSLRYEGLPNFLAALLLFAAECHGFMMFTLTAFINIRPLQRRSEPLPHNRTLWPSVDIVIPTYDEPVELVKITMAAAAQIDYPRNKLRIYLLDDGATQAKLCSESMIVRQTALKRRKDFQALCAQMGMTYLSRSDNRRAKAGNLNAALAHIASELILVLDADHAPARDILLKTAGAFVADDRLFLVQTPHFFVNPDPVERNLSLFNRMPSESAMFYGAIQKGLDFWQASFFCGSAAVLRRKAIDDLGGFEGRSITEDSETALLLHARGWRSHYLMQPLVAGLNPETFTSFMTQRMRWAQGMVQNFIFHNPLLTRGLNWYQRLAYLSSMAFWFFPFARVIFLISPGFFLFFDMKIYNANFDELLTYTLPYLATTILMTHFLFGKVRWALVSEIYETLQSLFSIRAVWAVLRNPDQPTFKVTPKAETLDKVFISPLALPFYWTLALTAGAIIAGGVRWFHDPEHRELIAITLAWAAFNFFIVMSALGALLEQRQRRLTPRIPVKIGATWCRENAKGDVLHQWPVVIRDLSMGGSNVFTKQAIPPASNKAVDYLDVIDPSGQVERYRIKQVTRHTLNDGFSLGIKLCYTNLEEFSRIVRLIYGDSERWMNMQFVLGTDPGLLKTVAFVVRSGAAHGIHHFERLLKLTFGRNSYDTQV